MLWRHFKYPAALSLLLIGGSLAFLQYSETQLLNMQQEFASSNLEQFRLKKDIERYRELQNLTESPRDTPSSNRDKRINWINSLHLVKQNLHLPFLEYRFSKLHEIPLDELSNNSYHMQASLLDITLHLKSLGQLAEFFQNIKSHIATFSIRNCFLSDLTMQSGKIKRSAPHITASCKLSIFYTEKRQL